jgi:hypothetical protein
MAQPTFSFLLSSRTEPPPWSGAAARCRPGLPAVLLPPPWQARRPPAFPHRIASPLHCPPPPFLSLPKQPALMPPPPATTRRPRSLPDPIKGSHTAAGAQRPRHHSPFLPSILGAPPSPSHFGRCLLPPSPGRLAAVHSRVRSQAGSSPPPPLFGYRIGEPECHPGCSPVSSVLPSMADPPWTEAGCGPRPVDQIHGFFLTKIILKSIIPGSFAKNLLGFSKINPQSMIS